MDYSTHYASFHPDTKSHREKMTHYYIENLRDLDRLHRDSKILEIGSGGGYAVLALERMGFKNIFAYDIDEGQVALALKNGVKTVHFTDEQASEHFEKEKNVYDVIIAFDVLEHVQDESATEFLRRIYGAKKTDGIAVLQVPNAFSPAATHQRYIDLTHQTIYSVESLTHRATLAGFTEITIKESINPGPIGLKRIIKSLTMRPLATFARLMWRIIMVEHYGMSAFSDPISKNIILLAK